MKRNRKILVVAMAMIIAVVTVTGCDGDILRTKKNGETYRRVEAVVLPMAMVRTLNPVISKDEDTYFISKLIYEGLFSLDNNMTPQKALAKEYSFDKENGTLTVDLVDTVWHDGKPLTSQDVIFSLKAYQRAGTNSQYSALIDRIDKIEAEGSGRIVVHFDSKTRMSLNALTFPIIPAHPYSSVAKLLEPDAGFIPIGTGPYKCTSYSNTLKLQLAPNEVYHGTKVKNSITFEVLPDNQSAYKLLQAGSISMLVSRDMDRQGEITKKGVKTVNFPGNEVEFIGFNVRNKKLKDAVVRQGIAYGVNSKRIIDECYFGSGMRNENVFFPNYMGIKSEQDAYPYSVDKGSDAMKKAGYTMGKDGFLQDKDGTHLELNLIVDSKDTARVATAAIIEEDLRKMGVKIKVESLDSAGYLSRLKEKNYDMFLGGYQFDEQMDMRYLFGDYPENYTGYTNKTITNLMNDMYGGQTPEETKATYAKMKPIIKDEVPYYCILYKTYGAMLSNTIKGQIVPTWNNYYRKSGKWYCEYIQPKSDKNAGEKK